MAKAKCAHCRKKRKIVHYKSWGFNVHQLCAKCYEKEKGR